MTDGLDFSAEEFRRMSIPERLRLCRRLARRAELLADNDPDRRDIFLQIARGWDALAENLERHG
jgi:hypothetical protein